MNNTVHLHDLLLRIPAIGFDERYGSSVRGSHFFIGKEKPRINGVFGSSS